MGLPPLERVYSSPALRHYGISSESRCHQADHLPILLLAGPTHSACLVPILPLVAMERIPDARESQCAGNKATYAKDVKAAKRLAKE